MKDLSKNFEKLVSLRFQIYNSLFLTLPIDQISNTGILLPLLSKYCEDGMEQGKNPTEIINQFFEDHEQFRTEKQKLDFLFRVIQYVERQVVLVDALEDASYAQINDLNGNGSFSALNNRLQNADKRERLEQELTGYAVRIVLTAHPTQFYPGNVLAIITDLTAAIENNDLDEIRQLLQQLGKTPFFQKQKPSPLDEAVNLSWYLENVFYTAASKLYQNVLETTGMTAENLNGDLLQFGFWPGGDRDGNPFVHTDTTLHVAERLQTILMRCYYKDIRRLRRRLSFKGVYEQMMQMEQDIAKAINKPSKSRINDTAILLKLEEVKVELIKNHGGLFVEIVDEVINRVRLFGMHFASIDVRQDSRVIARAFDTIITNQENLLPTDWATQPQLKKLDLLFGIEDELEQAISFTDEVEADTLESIRIIKEIQQKNGERGAHRYIISNCRGAIDVARSFALASLAGWGENKSLDIVPLFETIEDLETAHLSMSELFNHPVYKAHLAGRANQQTIMLGFSDGTKDGGYFSANWNIYKAKENITRLAREHGITVVFFDGRGGPPARGGGNTQKFYASLGNDIENKQIQLTVQGQTISSQYGTVDSAVHNLENLLVAGLENSLTEDEGKQLSSSERQLLQELAERSQAKYEELKGAKEFMPYLLKMSPLKYYGQANIGSRPSKRGKGEMTFEDLRAIPFVGAWSQLKQNVPGFYGVGTSLKQLEDVGKLQVCKDLYKNSSFFKALCENSMQSLSKTYFPITQYMKDDKEFGSFWEGIYEEYKLSCTMLLKISGQHQLLETNPTSRQSIGLREELVLPLITIQQYALMAIRAGEESNQKDVEVYQKLVMRSMFGNINASRNSA